MDKEELEKLKWACARGEIATRDAAVKLGMPFSTFYKKIRDDVECYAVYRSNIGKRKLPETPVPIRGGREHEYKVEKRSKQIMSGYRAKSKIVDRLAEAKNLGMSYGQYVAYTDGVGRI
jgi:hypothetical protein